MGRTSDAKAKILDAAQALIELRGYTAIGVAEICKSAGVPKGSFYYFFNSKDTLTLAVVDREWELQHAAWTQVLGTDDSPLNRLRQLCELTADTLRAGQHSCGVVAGCLFGNLALELTNHPGVALRGRLQEIFEEQVRMVEKVVAAGQERGETRVTDTGNAARAVVAQLEGQIMFAKLYNDMRRVEALWANCLALLGVQRIPAPRVASAV
jgi:TetR/AcrR family transcriptional repressor of nem operon